MIMSIKCLMNGFEVNYPCSPVCALFGDCVTAFEKQKKARARTNADRIRAMSDEELAEVFGKLVHCGGCPMRDSCKVDDLPCDNVMLEWLKQPAEGE
jgi:hypothetical protein